MLAVLLEHGFLPRSANRHATAQMQRIAHEVFARANLHHATAQVADVVHRRLQSAIVATDDVRIAQADCDAHRREGVQFVLGVFAASLISENEGH